jgi:polyphosphate:AMP phosphotransferase
MSRSRRLQQALKGRHLTKLEYEQQLPPLQDRLLDAQFELRTQKSRAVALVVTGIPAAGRSEVVNELLGWLDPKFVTVFGYGDPNVVERDRPVLWRYWLDLPEKGRIAIFHAGWYHELLRDVVKRVGTARTWNGDLRRAAERIRQLEAMLEQDGIRIAKVHLHVDANTQRKRLEKLESSKLTRWRVTRDDRWLARHFREVEQAYEQVLDATDQPAAPWCVVDGTDAQHRALEVGRRLLEALDRRDAPKPVLGVKAAADARRERKSRNSVPRAAPVTHPSDDDYDRELEVLQGRLAVLSRRKRFARHAVIAVFEGMDAAGKGGSIRRVTAALDARQYRDVPVSAPTPEELAHPYLWRFWRALPARAHYTIFDRSWYGRVLVERVRGFAAPPDWQRAYAEINEFERQLTEHRIVVAKFWLSVGREEQLERFAERDRNPLKRFKVDPEDWENRKHWAEYQRASQEMLARTHTPHAPWTVVAADDKRHARLTVLRALVDHIEAALD